MTTPTTVATYPLSGVVKDFDITFDYLSQTFVQVTLIGGTNQVLTLGTDYEFISATAVRTFVAYGAPDWQYIEVRRVTSTTERLVEFNDASILHASDLNLSDLQVIHIAEEARNAATETIGVNNDGNLDARGRRIVNVADPVDLGDAVTIRWYEAEVDGLHTDRLAAEAAKVAAQASQTSAASSASSAASSASSASTSASSASTSASNAATSEANALAYRNTTLTYRNEAQGFRNEAETFKNSASASASAAATSEANAAAYAASINPADIVHKSGDETIGGIKTFSASPVLPGNATTALQAVPKQQLDSAIAGAPSVPAGAVMPFAMVSPPSGWLVANGAAVSRTTYSTLFSAIGTTFGSGDGLTTFNLPDLRGEFIRGADSGRGVDVGRQLGSAQTDQNKSHTHTGTAASNGAHTHTTHGHNNNSYNNNATAGGGSEIAGGGTTSSAGAHTHTLTIDAAGGNEARPRNIALLYCIKA